jgi:thymidylate kinase
VFALLGYAIKQWSTCEQVPQEAVDLLQLCRDLLFDLNRAWSHIMSQQQQQQQQQQQEEQTALQGRTQRWLRLVAEAAAECIVINNRRPVMR